MNKMYIHFQTESFDATIKLYENNNEIFSISTTESLNDEIGFEVSDFNEMGINVYPHKTSNYLSYNCKIFLKNDMIYCNNHYIKIFKLPKNHYYIKLYPLSIFNKNLESDKIEVEKNNIKCLDYLEDICGRARVEVYASGNKNILKKEEYFVYLNDEKVETPNEYKLLDFFQSIFANDFKYANSLLTASLQEVLNKNAIKEYFGKFNFCKMVNYYDQISVVIFYEKECQAKVYTCNFDYDKISDIYEIN